MFDAQEEVLAAFQRGELDTGGVIVLRFQGPKANGMPELHSLSPLMSVLQDRGVPIALVTDGRMSGASGKTPAAIHVSPEALDGGPLAFVHEGDLVRLDAEAGVLTVAADLSTRERARPASVQSWGYGRELFGAFRAVVSSAEQGASVCFVAEPTQQQPEIRDVADANVQDREIDA